MTRHIYNSNRIAAVNATQKSTVLPLGCVRVPIKLYTGSSSPVETSEAIVPKEHVNKVKKYVFCILDGPSGTPYVSVRKIRKPSIEFKSLSRFLSEYRGKRSGRIGPRKFVDPENCLNWSPDNFIAGKAGTTVKKAGNSVTPIKKQDVKVLPNTIPRKKVHMEKTDLAITLKNGIVISGFNNVAHALTFTKELSQLDIE